MIFLLKLSLEERRYLTIKDIKANINADMLTEGQLTVSFNRKHFITEEVPIMEHIYHSGKIT